MPTPTAATAVRRTADVLDEVAKRSQRLANAARALADMAEIAYAAHDTETLDAVAAAATRLRIAARAFLAGKLEG
ncbi:MAG: hypothetical protein OXT07_01995 [bacterium]|nr:hypothetical protein [bacterium]